MNCEGKGGFIQCVWAVRMTCHLNHKTPHLNGLFGQERGNMYLLCYRYNTANACKEREEGYKGLHSGLTIAGLTITHELWYIMAATSNTYGTYIKRLQ